jgi:hypothetical protein
MEIMTAMARMMMTERRMLSREALVKWSWWSMLLTDEELTLEVESGVGDERQIREWLGIWKLYRCCSGW